MDPVFENLLQFGLLAILTYLFFANNSEAKDFFAVVSGGSGETKVETAAAEPVAASDEWMMLVGEETHGPYSLAELQSWVSDGAIDPGTWVSNGGEWVVASDAK